ncbi:MAG TPA: zinc ABC transporter substrate-binding protein [Ktedonobacterales bacterium]|nr:zinc ABC transporter substrate-binding protein [Ktedonobacterales bacterium]
MSHVGLPHLAFPASARRVGQMLCRQGVFFSGFLALTGLLLALSSCGSPASAVSGGVVKVVAGENFWGSIAAQLGGSHASVISIVSDPNTDPHEYESSTDDARAFAQVNYVILNGAGYDTWGQKLLDANPVTGRKVFTVADILGKKEGDNPHFWYNPDYVEQVANQITADFKALDPADATYFSQQRTAFEDALKPYHNRINEIKQKFGGQKVGATEDIFAYLSNALGLDLISPPAFMQAVAEGNDPPAATVAEFQEQIRQKQITVLVYNVQTVTAVTTNLKQLASQESIPVVGVTETIQPHDSTFQDWQYAQLLALQNALNANALGN